MVEVKRMEEGRRGERRRTNELRICSLVYTKLVEISLEKFLCFMNLIWKAISPLKSEGKEKLSRDISAQRKEKEKKGLMGLI